LALVGIHFLGKVWVVAVMAFQPPEVLLSHWRSDLLISGDLGMQCPRCQHKNEAGAKFCENCAAPLVRACGKCGRPLSPTISAMRASVSLASMLHVSERQIAKSERNS
jgi:predicted amidophosphoribosyltransferase